MLSNYLKPLNVLCIVCYIAFMGLALDSQALNAVVLYISENGEKPVYLTAKAETAALSGSVSDKEPVVAIQYKSKLADVNDVELPEPTVTASEESEDSSVLNEQVDNETMNELGNVDIDALEAGAPALSEAVDVDCAELSVKSADTKKELLAAEMKKIDPGYVAPPSDDSAPSALSYIEAIGKKKWEYSEALDKYFVRYDKETLIMLTIKPSLQKMTEGVLSKYSTRIGAAIIQDPATGEILAMTSSHKNKIVDILSKEYKTENWALRPTFPVASLFKIITAAAGIDTKKITPKSSFLAWGKTYMTVWKAFASSHNGVFARIAKKTGRSVVEKYAEAFGFNKSFFFDLPVSKSIAELPANNVKMGEAAAGLSRDFLVSPVHVAQIVSTVLNRGKMMKPYLVDYVIRKNKVIFQRKPFQLAQPIKTSTARDIYKMMYATTAVGTGKKGFGGYRKCPNLSKVCGGKTGTLTGASPNYLFTWFGGFTKAAGRDLCIVTLSGQTSHSGTKAASIAGQLAYELHMKRYENNDSNQMIASR